MRKLHKVSEKPVGHFCSARAPRIFRGTLLRPSTPYLFGVNSICAQSLWITLWKSSWNGRSWAMNT